MSKYLVKIELVVWADSEEEAQEEAKIILERADKDDNQGEIKEVIQIKNLF